MSVGPPGAKPTIIRTVRVGYACARAWRGNVGSAAAPAARCRNRRRGNSIVISSQDSRQMGKWRTDLLTGVRAWLLEVAPLMGDWHKDGPYRDQLSNI